MASVNDVELEKMTQEERAKALGMTTEQHVQDHREVDIDAEHEKPAHAGRDETQRRIEEELHLAQVEQSEDDEEYGHTRRRPEYGWMDA